MKKILLVFGTLALALAMFFSTNAMNSSNGDLDLATLITMNEANAEYPIFDGGCVCKTSTSRCVKKGIISFRKDCPNRPPSGQETDASCQITNPNGC
ncbi:hypothetical protein ACJOV8_017390 [Formosa sp. 3Alg 14/1]|uniref:hypothetical protein n=1 Tax=Formosa sp. 3Alg 14/1 TaxID=3382190 RepID=UPI0039BE7F08